MSKEKTIKIVIADDHKMFLEGIISILSQVSGIKIINAVTNGNDALTAIKTEMPDVLVTDINMPSMDGLKLTKEIVKNYPGVNILVLSMHHEENVVKSMFKNGIKGYLFKDTDKDELISAIKTVASGETYINEEINKLLSEGKANSEADKMQPFPSLSDREIEILKFIANELTHEQIAEKLNISEHTVIFHRRKLLAKLDVRNTAGLIKKAMDLGFL